LFKSFYHCLQLRNIPSLSGSIRSNATALSGLFLMLLHVLAA
jgi:hypothetical protein